MKIKYYKRYLLVPALLCVATLSAFSSLKAQSEDEIVFRGPVDLESLGLLITPTAPINQDLVSVLSYAGRGSITSATLNDMTELMDIQVTETVNTQVTFPTDCAGQSLIVEPLDGGTAEIVGDEAVRPDGTAELNFTAGMMPGLYRVRISAGEATLVLTFWLRDRDNLSEVAVLVPM